MIAANSVMLRAGAIAIGAKVVAALVLIAMVAFVIRCSVEYNKKRRKMTPEERARHDEELRQFMSEW